MLYPIEHPNCDIFRPIHYLGSKLRIMDDICEILGNLIPTNSTVCDLFSGSGTATAALLEQYNVISVDIQSYSQIICSALSTPHNLDDSRLTKLKTTAKNFINSESAQELAACFSPVFEYEQFATTEARSGNLLFLAELLENGSLVTAQENIEDISTDFRHAIVSTCERLKRNHLWDSTHSIISRYYGGVYFSYQQAVMLDILLQLAEYQTGTIKDIIRASCLSTASQIVNTVGKQFAQPIRPRDKNGKIKKTLAAMVSKDRYINTFDTFILFLDKYASFPFKKETAKALTGDWSEVLSQIGSECAAIYADPPYTRDHYSRFYHVLETMCKLDNPLISKTKNNGTEKYSRGVYRVERHQSPFCIKSEAPSEFDKLFKMSCEFSLPLVLSYSPFKLGDGTHPRVMTQQLIDSMAKKYFTKVKRYELSSFQHSILNTSELKLKQREQAEVVYVFQA